LQESISAQDFGVVGDGTTDDTVGFTAACAAAVTAKRPLNIQGLKIYLASQASSIPSDGLYLIGSGYLKGQVAAGDIDCIPVDWTYEVGTAGAFATNKAIMVGYNGSVIFSQYNGPIFTGKTFSGENFTVIGDPLYTSNSAFIQTTATTYPGWSQPFKKLKNASFGYFGSHGLQAMGGSELTTIENVSVMYCKGYCLYIGKTTGVNSPIEYLEISHGWYASGLLGNIYLEGVGKEIEIHHTTQLSPGQLSRRAAGGYVISTRSQIIYPIFLKPANGSLIISAVNISIHDNLSEYAQGNVALDAALSGFPYWYNVDVRNNYLIPYNNAWPFYNFQLDNTFIVGLTTTTNFSPSACNFYLISSTNHQRLDIEERFNTTVTFNLTYSSASPYDDQYIPTRTYNGDSGSLGDGTAAYFQTTIFATSFTTPANKAGVPTLYLITANYKDNTNNSIGAYLLTVIRTPNGQWFGTTVAFGSVTGFSSPPGVATNGAIYVNTTLGYYCRVKQLNLGVINPASY
jgi:hypothetical protein